jgi:hypothetical protein
VNDSGSSMQRRIRERSIDVCILFIQVLRRSSATSKSKCVRNGFQGSLSGGTEGAGHESVYSWKRKTFSCFPDFGWYSILISSSCTEWAASASSSHKIQLMNELNHTKINLIRDNRV